MTMVYCVYMAETTTAELKTYDETYTLPLVAYEATDLDGKQITINKKIPINHQSESIFDQYAPVFYNIGWILQNYDACELDHSQTPEAKAHRKEGTVKIYTKNNFIKTIGLDNLASHDKTQVVVLYRNDKPVNYTLTYSIYPK